jgi:excinuclease UvrABC nuclease subunit
MNLEFRPVKEGHAIAPWVRSLKGKSGCYIIREKNGFLFFAGEILYIGESHSGRLNTTLLRHFQKWSGKTAGPTFAVSKVEVAVVRCPAARALDLQNALIAEHRPKLNTIANPDAEK